MQHLVYLHGFLSSPDSIKAKQTLAYAKKHFPYLNVHTPKLPGNINNALKVIDALLASLPMQQVGFIGSSMGGFLATYCVETYLTKRFVTKSDSAKAGVKKITTSEHNPRAVLVNPAVEPHTLLKNYMGKHINPYTQEVFYIHQEHLHKLQSLYTDSLKSKAAYKVLLQTHDETLDYRLALNKYQGASITVEEGGDHSFVDYDKHLPSTFAFLLSKA